MNQKQALALMIGLMVGVSLVVYPWPHSRPHRVSSQTQANGEIVTTYESAFNIWPPIAFAAVIAATGLAVFGLRRA